jgi:hypothetical protein
MLDVFERRLANQSWELHDVLVDRVDRQGSLIRAVTCDGTAVELAGLEVAAAQRLTRVARRLRAVPLDQIRQHLFEAFSWDRAALAAVSEALDGLVSKGLVVLTGLHKTAAGAP